MKTLFKKNILIYFILSLGLALLLNSCKKENNTPTTDQQSGIEKRKQYISEQIKDLGGIPQRVELNQRMQIGYADMNGNIVTEPKKNLARNLASMCGGDAPEFLDLSYYFRLYTCGVGYKIRFGWIMSWNNTVVLTNPNNTANKTKGTVKISITGNSNAYNGTTYDVIIVDYGADPDVPGNNIYLVNMTSDVVSADIVNAPGAVLRLGGYFASDCSTLDNYSIIPMGVTGFGFSTPLNSDPCTRNDKVWFLPPGVVGSDHFEVAGYDPVGTCPLYDAGAVPSYQEVQYSLDDGSTWTDFANSTSPYSGTILGSRFVSKLDFASSATLSPGAYDVLIRYRNIKYNSGVTGNPIPDNTNSCSTISWTNPLWTTESFHGIVIY